MHKHPRKSTFQPARMSQNAENTNQEHQQTPQGKGVRDECFLEKQKGTSRSRSQRTAVPFLTSRCHMEVRCHFS